MINHIGNTIIALSQLLHSTIMYITIMHELQSITIFAVVIFTGWGFADEPVLLSW